MLTRIFAFLILAASLFLSVPAYANSIRLITLSNITFTGTGVCTPSPCTEVFNASWKWDATKNTLVAGSLKLSSSGPLGSFVLAHLTSYSFQFYNDLFTASAAVSWYFDERFPSLGLYPLSEVYLYCWTDTACASDFKLGYSHPISGTVRVAAVPEPCTLLLVAGGMGVILRSKKKG